MPETVKLQVTADASQVNPELAKVQRDIGDLVRKSDDLSEGFKRVGSVARDVFGALGIAASVGAAASAIASAGKAAIAYGDAMQKAAARTGIASGQFAVLADAARQSDIDVDALSKGLQRMQVAISQAGSGAKAPLETFGALGIEFDNLRTLAPEDQFLRLADRISQMQDPADRVRAALELFGKRGADLLPFFEQGAAGIKKATDEIERLGGALTSDQIAKLSEADAAIKRMDTAWSNLARTLTAEVAPALASTFERYAKGIEFIKKNGLFGTQEQWDAMFAPSAPLGSAARTGALSRGGGSGVLSGGAPGYAASAASGSTAGNRAAAYSPSAGRAGAYDDPNRTAGRQGGGITLGDPAGSRAAAAAQVDPLSDPRVLYESQVYGALVQQHDEYAASMYGKVDELNSTWLGQILSAGQTHIDAETFKNQTIGSLMGNLVGTAIQQGGALGKHSKALAIAQTVWSGATAVIETFKNAGGYPFGIAPAAIMAGTVAMQLANIKKTNVGSGGGSVSVGAGASLPSSVPASAAMPNNLPGVTSSSTESSQRSAVNIYVSGNLMSGQESVRWLAEQLGELINSNDLVFINGNSRQAIELAGR